MGNCLSLIIRIIAMGNWLSQTESEESTEASSTSSSIFSEATGVGSGQYDVYLSFNGLDTCKEFIDHLYQSLKNAGIVPFRVFKDDKSIPIGEKFGSQIFDAIARSKISIPIICENYVSSKWCLCELAYMMNCKENSSHTVLPIFYKISPSDVRHLMGNFEKALSSSTMHFDEKDIQEGRRALEEVGKLEGWESEKFANGHEGELIKRVVETVRSKLPENIQLDVPKQLVGIDDHLKEIMDRIDSSSSNARMIGIYGTGGIGKTTLAKCIINQCSNKFWGVRFLPDVRETARRHGITHLRNLLISDILNCENEVFSPFDGKINIIKSTFKRTKVLIVLDDVDENEQLDALAGEPDWFGEGSLVIVTTRNKAVLEQSKFKVDSMHELNGLNKEQSLRLFNIHAFRTSHSLPDFEGISHDIISTMDGLPLAIEVVGSSLYQITDRNVWEDMYGNLKSQPDSNVRKILRISYDALEEEYKQIFVDIACFFIGKNREFAMCMWEGCGFYPSLGVDKLKSRCLIKIGEDGKFEMHDQLRDLGRSIFCEGQPLEYCSGPWDDNYKGVPRVLRQDECRRRFHDLIRPASSGDEDLSEVRWLQWWTEKGDSSILTANLHLLKLAVLEIGGHGFTEEQEGWSLFKASTRLRALNLAGCWHLRTTPDLSAFIQLKILIVKHCRKLEHLHPSIGELKSLVSLDLSYCQSLKELPEEVGELKDLEELDLSMSGVTQIPASIHSLGKLKKLNASNCKSLSGIPSSIGNLSSLKELNLKTCKSLREIPSSIGDLHNLQHLDIHFSGIEELPSAIGRLINLQTLDISWTPISHVPESIRNLSSLQRLCLEGCNKCRSVPELPSSLAQLSVSGQSLRLPQLCSLIHLEGLHLEGCHLLEDIPDLPSRLWKLDGFRYLEAFSISRCSSIEILNLSELVHLKKLEAQRCYNLVEIQCFDNLEFLEHISIRNCNSIKIFLCSESQWLKKLEVVKCNNLVEIQGCLYGAEILFIDRCKSLETLPDLTVCEKLRSLIVKYCNKLAKIPGLEKLDRNIWQIFGHHSLTLPSTN